LEEQTLTQMQLLGVAAGTNVAEGHPRHAPTPAQRRVIARLGEFVEEAAVTPYPALEARAYRAFSGALGQISAPIGSGRLISFYSSSIAIDVICRCLGDAATSVGVIHPTLDCIPELLKSRGLRVVPIPERALHPDALHRLPEVDALFIATPNNPTGTVLRADALRANAEFCAERGIPLVIDSCFRAFDRRAYYDAYTLLESSGVEWVVVEDSGKVWPLAGIKLGFLAYSPNCRLPLAAAASDLLLTAPPFSALVVEALSLDMADGGLDVLHDLVARNRRAVAEVVDEAGLKLAYPSSRVSVAMIGMPEGMSATRLWGRLLRHGVHTVPCRPFYWAQPARGDRYLRVALARDPEVVERAARAIVAEVSR
jgi:aspartate/methionine/tyrosine aminotransferase